MIDIPIYFFQSLLFFFLIFIFLYNFSKKLGLIDYPDTIRKKHLRPVPAIGGLIIYFSILIIAFLNDTSFFLRLVIISSLFVVIISSFDDSMNIGIFPRFLSQVFASMIIIGFDLNISYIGTFPFFGEIHMNNLSILFTLFCILLTTNAYNFIDGIDGLTGSQFVMSFIILFFYIFIENKTFLNSSDLQTLSSLFFLVIIFLFFNLGILNSKKIFLGDAGSNFLGFVIGWILIYFSYIGIISPIMCIWIVALPCIDLLRVFIVRITNKSSPLRPDRRHIHFLLIEQKYSNINILLILSLISLFFGVIGYISVKFGNDFISLISFIFISTAYYLFIEKYIKN